MVFIERSRVRHKALEVIKREVNHRGPQDALVLVLRKPEVEIFDDTKVTCPCSRTSPVRIIADNTERYVRRRKPRKLRLHFGNIAALRVEFQNAAHESG